MLCPGLTKHTHNYSYLNDDRLDAVGNKFNDKGVIAPEKDPD